MHEATMHEVRAESASGGQKGRKMEQPTLIPPDLRLVILGNMEESDLISQREAAIARGVLDFERGLPVDLLDLAAGAVDCVATAQGESDLSAWRQLSAIYGYGATKYSRDNYLLGYPYSWTLDAFWRHFMASAECEWKDPESGYPHLLHCAWHCLALREFVLRGVGEDDRLWVGR